MVSRIQPRDGSPTCVISPSRRPTEGRDSGGSSCGSVSTWRRITGGEITAFLQHSLEIQLHGELQAVPKPELRKPLEGDFNSVFRGIFTNARVDQPIRRLSLTSTRPSLKRHSELFTRYKRMYLHVDLDDPAAMGLYSSMGYQSMEQYDTPVWIRRLLGMPTIRYQVKQFKLERHTR